MYDFRAQGIGQDAESRPEIAPPSWLLTAGEPVRFASEYAVSWLLDRLPGPVPDLGQGRAVLVLPGFGATDRATGRLREHLDLRGWTTYAWGVGPNHGLTDEVLDGVLARFDTVVDAPDEQSRRPIDVVGWSFGGLLARWVAHQRPGQVRSVVTLGSPWRPEGERTRTTPLFERARRSHGLSERAEKIIDELRGPLPVPTTAIWSKTDGIVGWRGCVVDESETARNVAVRSSHLGMASNPFALVALTAALARAGEAGR